MDLRGDWYECDDGVVRPTILIRIRVEDRVLDRVRFVVDTAADHTVLSAALLPDLPALLPPPPGLRMAGAGGVAGFGVVHAALEIPRPGLIPVTIRGDFVAFNEVGAIDMSLLGRDVLDNFDVIVSRRRDTVALLGGNHRFAIQSA